ncbi:MAG: phage portal protein [Muricomes sp.]
MGERLATINDHPKVNIDPHELERISRDFREYAGNYPLVKYINSNNDACERDYCFLNMRKLTSEMMSSLVFNEQVEIKVDNEEADKFIQHIFEHNDFKKNMIRYLEPMFAAGGIAVRPYVDSDTGEVEFSWALANAFFPLRHNSGGITEGVMMFSTVKTENKKTVYYTLLEFHEWNDTDYVITNELYRSEDQTVIGDKVPLGYNDIYDGIEPETTITGLNKPIFNYLKPSGFNNFSLDSPLGVGICDNASTTLKQINDAYDQFNWEIRMGQRSVIVSDHLLNYTFDEKGNRSGAIFDPDINIYKAMRMDDGKETVKDITNDIRTEQYIAAINQFFKTLEMQMQLSVGTFSFDGQSVKTATEIVSENSLTYRTRNMQCNEVEKFIKGLIVSVLEIAAATTINSSKLYTGEIPTFEQISVDFDDGIFESAEQKLEFYSKAKAAGVIPPTKAMEGIFKITEEESMKWLKLIIQQETMVDPAEIEQEAVDEEIGEEE